MVDGADAGGWSAVADDWSRMWGTFARPAHDALVAAAGIGTGTRVLDVGCGSGEFLALMRGLGAAPVGVDPSAGMRRIAGAAGFDVHDGDAEHLPFPSGAFEVVTAVNALQFADDAVAALREAARVTAPGGRIAVANWADAGHNDIDTIEHAVALADDSDPLPDGPLRAPGGLEAVFDAAGLAVSASGIVNTPWHAADDDELVTGILLGAEADFVEEMRPVVVAAARAFRVGAGYVLHNRFRWAVASTPG